MALQGPVTLGNGITLSGAYLIVNQVNVSYKVNDKYINLEVLIYKDSTSFNNGNSEVLSLTHTCSGTDATTYFDETVLDDLGKTPLTQAYAWLKTLSQYTMAEV